MKTPKKRCELGEVLHLLVLGKTKAQIRKKTGLSSTALSNHLRRLEELDNIKRLGKYQIKVISSSLNHPRATKNKVHKDFNKRGHAHNITIHFKKKIELKELPKVKTELKAGLFEILEFGSLKFTRKGFTIWINKHNLTIYSNNSYFSENSLHSKFRALREIDNLVENLVLKYNFPKEYGIEVFREHYGLIFNKFAQWLIKKGKKMYVKDHRGKSLMWVDKSRKDDIGLQEFESEDPILINNSDTFFNSHEDTGWKNNAYAIENNTKEIKDQKKVLTKSMQVLEGYAQQISLHLKVEQAQEKHLKDQTEIFKEIKDLLQDLKKNG